MRGKILRWVIFGILLIFQLPVCLATCSQALASSCAVIKTMGIRSKVTFFAIGL